jgi:hypothetical protein
LAQAFKNFCKHNIVLSFHTPLKYSFVCPLDSASRDAAPLTTLQLLLWLYCEKGDTFTSRTAQIIVANRKVSLLSNVSLSSSPPSGLNTSLPSPELGLLPPPNLPFCKKDKKREKDRKKERKKERERERKKETNKQTNKQANKQTRKEERKEGRKKER